MVDWETFIKLHCIFEEGNPDLDKMLKFWTKFFDQDLKGFCAENEYLPVIEQLVRGKCLDKENKSTKMFAKNYQTKLREAGCLGLNNEIMMDKFETAHLEGKLDLRNLSFAIGNRDSDIIE